VACVYQDDADRIRNLLGTDGQLIRLVHQPTTWPPSYAVLRSGTGRYFVVIAGTTNVSQGVRHVAGTFWRDALPDGSRVHGQWRGVEETLWEEIRPLLPEDLADGQYFISGHSYGGAVGQLMAERIATLTTPATVQLMTFGAARARTIGYEGPEPANHWRIASTNDAVQFLAVDESLWGSDNWIFPPAWTLLPVSWSHYGRGRSLGWNGFYGTSPTPPVPPPTGVNVGVISEHLLGNYHGRLRQRLLNVEATLDAIDALAIMDATLNRLPQQALQPGLPTRARIPPGVAEIPIPEPPGFTPSPKASLIMAAPVPVPVAIQRMMHITFFFNAGPQGWTESWYANVIGNDTDPYSILEVWAQEMNLARRKVMPDDFAIVGTRIADVDTIRDASTLKSPYAEAGPGNLDLIPAHYTLGWFATVNDVTNQVRATRIFRGWPSVDVPYDLPAGTNPVPKPTRVTSFINEIRPKVTRVWNKAGVTGSIQCCLRSYFRGNPIDKLVTKYLISTDGWLQFEIADSGNVPLFNVGDYVRLGAKRMQCVRGLNGTARIIGVAPESGRGPYTTDKRLCCGKEQLAGMLGRAQLREVRYYYIDELNAGLIGKRDTGAANFSTVGRRGRRCC